MSFAVSDQWDTVETLLLYTDVAEVRIGSQKVEHIQFSGNYVSDLLGHLEAGSSWQHRCADLLR